MLNSQSTGAVPGEPAMSFVGRTHELERYQKFLTRDTPWILIIRGLGGSGKTALLSEFEKQTPRDTCVVTLDFAQKTLREDYLTFLEGFSQQVEPYCDAERTVDFRKSIATGRFEIGKRVAGSKFAILMLNLWAILTTFSIDCYVRYWQAIFVCKSLKNGNIIISLP